MFGLSCVSIFYYMLLLRNTAIVSDEIKEQLPIKFTVKKSCLHGIRIFTSWNTLVSFQCKCSQYNSRWSLWCWVLGRRIQLNVLEWSLQLKSPWYSSENFELSAWIEVTQQENAVSNWNKRNQTKMVQHDLNLEKGGGVDIKKKIKNCGSS